MTATNMRKKFVVKWDSLPCQLSVPYKPVQKWATSANGAHVKIMGMAHEQVELNGQKIPLKLFVAPQLVIELNSWVVVLFLEQMNQLFFVLLIL